MRSRRILERQLQQLPLLPLVRQTQQQSTHALCCFLHQSISTIVVVGGAADDDSSAAGGGGEVLAGGVAGGGGRQMGKKYHASSANTWSLSSPHNIRIVRGGGAVRVRFHYAAERVAACGGCAALVSMRPHRCSMMWKCLPRRAGLKNVCAAG